MKMRKGPILLAVLIAAVLTAAFLRGGQGAAQGAAASAPAAGSQPAEQGRMELPGAELPSGESAGSGKPDTAPAPTEPAAQEAPAPEPENAPTVESQEPETPQCTISISCATIRSNMDLCPPEKAELVPEDGWILQPTTVSFTEGESVFDVLQRTCRQEKIHMEYMDTPGYGSAYIEGISNLYEFDVGELSGWMYSVNGQFPNYGCSQALLQDSDVVCWVYTCDYGADVGGNNLTV